MKGTFKAILAGILTIIGGIMGIVVGAMFATVGVTYFTDIPGLGLMARIGVGILAIGIIALIAGIFTMRRRSWPFAMVGSILALFPFPWIGAAAIIFVAMSKREFS